MGQVSSKSSWELDSWRIKGRGEVAIKEEGSNRKGFRKLERER